MLDERFIELLTKKLSGEISEGELKEFEALLAGEDLYREQYRILKSYWTTNNEQYADSDLLFRRVKTRIAAVDEDPGTYSYETKMHLFSPLFWRGLAAALLVGICCTLLYHFRHRPVTAPVTALQVVKIPSRSKSRIVLSDGSVITLNSETVLKYPAEFSGPTREVYLSGEAFFDVAKDHAHPFIVHAGKMTVRVLGTAFNIKSYSNEDQSETTLIRGAIQVILSDRPSDRIILKPHDKLILNNKTFKIYNTRENNLAIAAAPDSVITRYALTNLTYLSPNDTTVVETSWVNNKLVFKDETFNELANQMERWYGIKVKFTNQAVKEYRFTGIFEKESINQALNALQMIENFNYKVKNQTVYIY